METAPKITLPLSVFILYAPVPKDEALRQELEAHLSLLKNLGLITTWHHRKMLAGSNLQQELAEHLETATLILLLISADFLASEECYKEMQVVLERNKAGDALVIPIILRKVHLESTPFKHLLCLPRGGRPVRSWKDTDEAFTNIVDGIRETIEKYPVHQNKRISDKEKRLHALIPDHNGFLKDRLESFVGRQQELAEIQDHINQRLSTGGYITITGQAGQGKSSIIAKLIEISGVEQVAYHFISINPGPDHQVGLLRNLMARLILKYKLSDLYVASDNRTALRDYFPKVLTDVANQGRQEIIFIDGLDQLEEDFNGVRDLSFLPMNPPPGIVFVLGTRPNDTMKPLELLKPHNEYRLPNLSRQDFNRILQRRDVSLKETIADQFYKIMGENALYLDLVAKELTASDAIDPLAIITRITANPTNIFTLSLERLKRQGQLWERVIYPVLGVLLTTQEPLSLPCMRDILQVEDYKLRDGIARLGGLLTEDTQRRYSLFHLKLQDYLHQDTEDPQKEYLFSVEEEEGWHARLALWCEQGQFSLIWQNVDNLAEQERRKYTRQHYITHLYYARKWLQLFKVLDEGSYGHAKMQYDPSTRFYAQDLDRGRQAAVYCEATWEEAIKMLPQLWRYTLLRGSLGSRADQYTREIFQLLLLLGREQEVLGLVELLTDPVYKVEILLLITGYLAKQPARVAEHEHLYFRASEVSYKMVRNDPRTIRVLRALISALIAAQQWERAEEVTRTIEDSGQQVEALSALASSLAVAQQWERARHLWTEAEEVTRAIENSYLQVKALSALASSLAAAQQWERAEEVTRAIDNSGQQVKALSALASSLAVAQQWERARHLWTEAEEVTRAIENSYLQVKALSALASSLAAAQQWERAEEVTRAIKDSYLQVKALSALASSLASAQQWERAEMICIEIERLIRLIKDSDQRSAALSALASSLAMAQQWERAEEVIRTIEDSDQQVKALSALASSLAMAQQWERAEEVIRAIDNSSQQVEVLSALASSLASAQQWERARHLWTEAEEVTRAIENSYLQVKALSALASSLAAAQQWERAEEVIRAIDNSYQRSAALSALASSLAMAQQWERAEEVTRTIEDSGQQVEALSALASSLAAAQQWERARYLWTEAEEVTRAIENSYQRSAALSALASSLAVAQQWERAEEVAHAIEDSGQQVKALSVLIDTFLLAHEYQQLISLIHTSWLQVETRDEAFLYFLLALGLISLQPEIGDAFLNGFQWADAFLNG